ncbi:hypothetical protein FF38_04271 [Lucilia cuprina]|uniref:Uncharacterized protein n=1 Tax=Lucilia cuprina TaxID=7375 RepID=A0A0L0BWM7_LUCCU|nr:hypothetical protein FF38_04271 [Lucilia cuprina]
MRTKDCNILRQKLLEVVSDVAKDYMILLNERQMFIPYTTIVLCICDDFKVYQSAQNLVEFTNEKASIRYFPNIHISPCDDVVGCVCSPTGRANGVSCTSVVPYAKCGNIDNIEANATTINVHTDVVVAIDVAVATDVLGIIGVVYVYFADTNVSDGVADDAGDDDVACGGARDANAFDIELSNIN